MSHNQYETSFLFSSSVEDGAINVSADGSIFEVKFQEPFSVPQEAKNVTVSVEEATYWNTSPNILSGVNDRLRVNYMAVDHDLIFPQGLYDINDMEERLAVLLEEANLPAGLVSVAGIESTQTVLIVFSQAATTIDFTLADTPREILGFNSAVIGSVGVAIAIEADNPAKFNTVEYLLISTDLVPRGIAVNGGYSNVIDRILIDEEPGSQVISRPFNPPKISANFLAGTSRSRIRFWLTDQAGNPVNTSGEAWSFRMVIRYHYHKTPHSLN